MIFRTVKGYGNSPGAHVSSKMPCQEHTHILICPGFATEASDYKQAGSLVSSLISHGGWNKNNIHVLPVKRSKWITPIAKGILDSDYIGALAGLPDRKCPPDRPPYRWYIQLISKEVSKIDRKVKAQYGKDAKAKIIVMGHSAGGWLARASIGYGNEQNGSSDISIDIDNILGIISLGTPNVEPPLGQADITGGALRVTNEKFPATYFEDKLFFMTIGGQNSQQNGDGIVSLEEMHLEGADQVTLSNVCHAADLCGSGLDDVWYGSETVVEEWFGKFLKTTSIVNSYQEHTKEGNGIAAAGNAIKEYLKRKAAIRSSGIFQDVKDPEALSKLIFSLEELPVKNGDKLITQGEDADAIYFICSGVFECYDESTGNVKATLKEKDVFGELGVILRQQRALSVRATSDGATVFKLKKESFETLIHRGDQNQTANLLVEGKTRNSYEDYFTEQGRIKLVSNCPVFRYLDDDGIQKVVSSMEQVNIKEGEVIIKEGTEADAMYIVVNGTFVCYRESNSNVLNICEKGDYFGDLGVIFGEPRQASVRASTASVVFKLTGEDFLDAYRKAKLIKLGAASWLFLLLDSQKTNLPIIKPTIRLCKKGFSSVTKFFDKVKLLDNHLIKGAKKTVSKAAIWNIFLCSSLFPIIMRLGRKSNCSVASHAIVNLGFVCLLYDNFTRAYGKYFRDETTLKKIGKMSTFLHGVSMPLLFIPLMETLKSSSLISKSVANICNVFFSAFALHEAIDWAKFDINQMKLVDNRDSTRNKGLTSAGGLYYTSGKVFKLVLPAALMNLSSIGIGTILLLNGLSAGKWLFSTSLFTFVTSALQEPRAQAFGETALILGIAMALFAKAA